MPARHKSAPALPRLLLIQIAIAAICIWLGCLMQAPSAAVAVALLPLPAILAWLLPRNLWLIMRRLLALLVAAAAVMLALQQIMSVPLAAALAAAIVIMAAPPRYWFESE